MKKSIYALLVACLLVFTGCIEIVEEMFLNKNGSGKYSIQVDMSALMAEGGLKDMMKGLSEDSTQAEPQMAMDRDTIIYMKDAPDSIRQRLVHPELMDRASMHMLMSEKDEKMIMSFNLDFKKVNEINHFLEDLDKMQAGSDQLGGAMSGSSGLLPSTKGVQKLFGAGKRLFTRYPTPKDDAAALKEEDMAMARMMLSGANYKTIYHFPGKVKKVSNKDAVVNGKTVSLEIPMTALMDGKADLSMEIKYKKR